MDWLRQIYARLHAKDPQHATFAPAVEISISLLNKIERKWISFYSDTQSRGPRERHKCAVDPPFDWLLEMQKCDALAVPAIEVALSAFVIFDWEIWPNPMR